MCFPSPSLNSLSPFLFYYYYNFKVIRPLSFCSRSPLSHPIPSVKPTLDLNKRIRERERVCVCVCSPCKHLVDCGLAFEMKALILEIGTVIDRSGFIKLRPSRTTFDIYPFYISSSSPNLVFTKPTHQHHITTLRRTSSVQSVR